jgi:hypothetical protein
MLLRWSIEIGGKQSIVSFQQTRIFPDLRQLMYGFDLEFCPHWLPVDTEINRVSLRIGSISLFAS